MQKCRRRRNQLPEEERLYRLIRQAVRENGEAKEAYWTEKLYLTWARRMRGLKDGTDWIGFISGMDDSQARGLYESPKWRRMMLLVRDAARVKNMYYIRNGKEVCDTNVAGGNPAIPKEFVAPLGPWYS